MMNNFLERIKVAWYALTSRHYAFFSYEQKKIGESGARCYIEAGAEKDVAFLETVSSCALGLKDKCQDMNYYYYSYIHSNGNGFTVMSFVGEFDIVSAYENLKDNHITGAAILYWKPISKQQRDKIFEYYGNKGNDKQ